MCNPNQKIQPKSNINKIYLRNIKQKVLFVISSCKAINNANMKKRYNKSEIFLRIRNEMVYIYIYDYKLTVKLSMISILSFHWC